MFVSNMKTLSDVVLIRQVETLMFVPNMKTLSDVVFIRQVAKLMLCLFPRWRH